MIVTPLPRRVVSLVASNTEIRCALGRSIRLVGVDDYSDYPPSVERHENVGRDLVIDVDRVASLRPDLVLASLSVPGVETRARVLHPQAVPVA